MEHWINNNLTRAERYYLRQIVGVRPLDSVTWKDIVIAVISPYGESAKDEYIEIQFRLSNLEGFPGGVNSSEEEEAWKQKGMG